MKPTVFAHNITDQRVIVYGVSWEQYQNLELSLVEVPGIRLTYLDYTLEIMSPSPEHETAKATIGLLLDVYLQKKDIRFYKGGSPTLKNKTNLKAKEPDECYCIDTKKDVPDIAIEVVLTSGGIDVLAVYQGLGVLEVWFFQQGVFSVYVLENNQYQKLSQSKLLPDLNLSLMATYVNYGDQFDALREWNRAMVE